MAGQGKGFSVADPRRQEGRAEFGQYGVKAWHEPSQVVIGKAAVGAGQFAVADAISTSSFRSEPVRLEEQIE